MDEIDPDLIVLQNITFANAAYASEILHRFTDVPILLWTLREPVIDGGRLRLNSLTGAYSAANAIKAFRKEQFEYIFGAPTEEKVEKKINATIRAAKLKYDMKSLKLSAIGHTPQGFGFGRALDLEMLEKFGVRLESIEARELIDKAKAFTDEECEEFLKDANSRMVGLDKTPEKNRLDFARLYKAYKDYVTQNNIGAVASRCWPDFFTSFGTPVCAVLAMLNDLGVAASCEADTYGALSMYLGMQLTGSAVFFGDPVSMDEKENTISFWHCGTAACSLARKDTGAVVGEHCNRHIGPTLEFGCRSSENATIFRIGKDNKGDFRFFIASGEILDKPQQFLGTSLVIKTNESAEKIVYDTVEGGWEPHYVVIYGDVADELEILAKMLDMDVLRF
jgi:L-fucose isomerase-like protein